MNESITNSHEDFELTPETLDTWELELDQFAAQMTRRINELAGNSDQTNTSEAAEAIQILQSLRNHAQ